MTEAPRLLIVACGALAREIRDVARLHQLDNVTLECLPAHLHNRPERIPAALRDKLAALADRFDRVLVGYADCGTAGVIDDVCDEFGADRLPGAHCYQFFAGRRAFEDMHDADPTTFYLTDYLARHFDRIVLDGLGITEHPELLPLYFGNYRRLVHLAQTDDEVTHARARAAAARLGLDFERVITGYGELQDTVVHIAHGAEPAGAAS